MRALRLLARAALALVLAAGLAAPALAQVCAVPGSSGPGSITGIVNTYYPGTAATLAAGSTSVSVGAADPRGSATAVAAGDLLLVIQVQDASITTTNSAAYGGSGGGSGYTSLGSSGLYEYVIATGPVSLGSIPIATPLANTYRTAAANATSGQKRYQVVRVPQYSSGTILAGTVTAPPWDGTTGGIVAFDVAGNLNWNGQTVDVSGRGFRGGGGQCSNSNGTGTAVANTDYRLAVGSGTINLGGVGSVPDGAKGEGIAGTPILVFSPTVPGSNSAGTVQNTGGVDGTSGGYPAGSFGRGAPGNAGGGGTDGNPTANDQNTGGAGGGNYGIGGKGGFGWTPGTPPGVDAGGFGGMSVPSAANRLFFGGGGGAATTNNCTGTPGNGAASSGAAGGGMVFIRAGTTTGGGTINAAGTAANSTIGNDASGGGGAGGSVLVFVDNSGGAIGASINVQGGAGGSNTGGGAPHGPGGGGSGGFAITSGPATVGIAGGAGGTTATSPTSTADYGSASSVGGFQVATLPASQIPGAGSTSACFPQLTVTKATTTPFIAAGTPATWTITATNLAGRGAATGVTIADTLPASPNITYLSTTSIALAGGATRTAVADPTAGTTTPSWGTFTIPGGGSVAITFQAQTNTSVPSGTVQNPGTASYLDPTRTAAQTVTPGGTYTAGGTVGGSNYASGSSTAEDVNVVNPPPAITKSFTPGAINVGATSVLQVSIANASAIALTNVTLTDTYPAGLVNSAAPNGASSCGGTVSAAPAGTGFSLAGASIPAGSTCTITVNVTITATGAYTNTIPIAALGNAQGIVNTAAATATLFSNVTVAKSFSPTAVAPNTDATLSLAIANPNGVALNLASPGLTDPFPANLVATGGAVTVAGAGCTGFAPATVAAGATSLVLTAGTLPANGTCTVSIAVRSAVAGTYNNTSSGVTTVQTGTTGPASNTAGLGVGLINIQKNFSPNTILAGGSSTVVYTLTNPTGVVQTGGTFLDTLINMSVGGTGAVSGTCTGTTPASFAPGATSLNFTGITIPAGSCTIIVPITSSTVGALPNATNGVTTSALPQGPGSNTDILNVLARPTIAKAFSPSTIAPGAASTLTFTLSNTGPIALTGAAFTDTYPAGLVNATPLVVGGTCTGVTHTAVAGGNAFNVTGGTIPANSSCTITVAVTAAAAGSYANTSGGVATTQTGAPVAGSNTAALDVAASPTIAKSFLTSPISQGGSSMVTFTITNANTIALTNVRFTDTLVNMSVASTTLGGSCAGTTNTPALVVGATALDLTVPTLAAGASCTVTVMLTSSVSGTNPNTTSGVTSTQTPVAGPPSNTANLVVLSPPTIAKNFVPGTIQAGGTSAITFTVANLNAAALTNVQWSDALVNMALGTGAAVTETCGGSVASAGVSAGSVNFNLTLNTLAAGETCTVTVSPVTSSTVSPAGGHPNTTTAITSTQTPAGGATATGFLNVVVAPTLTKAFSPNTVTSGTPNSTITFTLTNPNAVALTDIRFTDAFPANMRTRAIAQNFIGAGRGTCTGTIPSAQGAVNQTSLSFTSTTLAPGASCTILVDIEVTANGTYTNTTSGPTSDQTPTAGATASDVLTRGIVGVTKSFTPAVVQVNGVSTLQFRISNNSGNSRTGLAFTDTFPAGMTAVGGAVTLATVSGTACSGLAPATVAAGATAYNLTGLTIPNGSVCTVSLAVRGTTTGVKSNTVTGTAPTQFAGSTDTATLTVYAAPTIAKAFSPATIAAGGTSMLTFTLTNPNTIGPLTGAAFNDTLVNMSVAATQAPGGTCAGTLPASVAAGTTALAFNSITIPSGGSCTVSVVVTSSTVGTLPNTGSGVTTSQTATAGTGTGTVNLTVAGLGLTKTFGPTSLAVGQPSTLAITITNAGGVAWSGVGFTDTLPAGLVIANPANVATTCPAGTVTATPGGTTLAFSGGALLASTASCSVQANVTAATAGTRTNNAGNFSGLSTGVSATGANASVTHFAGPALTKAFSPASIAPGGTSTLTFTVTASPGGQAVSGVGFTDTLPAGLVVASTPAATNNCGGTFAPVAGSGSVTLSGASLAAAPASCTLSVAVTSAVLGTYANNATNVSGLAGGLTAATANASLSVVGTSLAKTFTPTTIGRGAASILAFTITNGAGNPAQSGLGFIENLPANVFVDAVPGIANTCGGTVTANPGAGSITLAGGAIPSGTGSCSFSARVTSSFAGSYLNNASRILNAPASMDTSPVNATLTVIENPTVAKSFGAASMPSGGTTTLSIVLSNPNGVALTGLAFTDVFPASPGPMTLASGASTNTCGGTLTNTGGGALNTGDVGVSLAGGTIPAGGSCTVTVNVTASSAGSYTNTLAAGSVTSANGGASAAPASASLTVFARPTVAKSFGVASLAQNGTTSLAITVTNPNAVALTGLAFTDLFPASPGPMTLANGTSANTCGGTLTDTASGALGIGDVGIVLSGGTVPANGSCTVTVNVTASTAGSYTNTLAAGSVSTTNGGTNAAPASATLAILLPPTVAKAFAPASIFPDGTSILTVTLTNPNATAIAGAGFTDNHPAGVVNDHSSPSPSNTCGGTLTASASATSFNLTGGTIPASGSCAVSVRVTSNQVGVFTNSTGPVATANAGTGTAATAQLTVVGEIGGTKTFTPATVAAGGTTTLTLTLANPNATTAVTGIAFTDSYPGGLANTATPGVTNTCGGTVTAAANGTSLALAGGSLAAGASCAITVQVTPSLPGTLVNTTGAVTAANAPTNAGGLSGTLVVLARPTVAKNFGASTFPAGGTTTLDITISNANAVALTGLAFTDVFPASPGPMTLANGTSTNTCGGTLTDTGGGALGIGDVGISLTGGTVPAGGSCTITVNVTASSAGIHVNTLAAGSVTTANGGSNAAPASSSVTVLARPTVAKSFGAAAIASGGTTTLAITVSNANAVALSGLALTDLFPVSPGPMTLANGTSTNTCGGTLTDTGSGALGIGDVGVVLSGGTVPAGGSCTITVNVTASTAGTYTNTLAAGSVTTTNGGSNAAAANASVDVLARPTVAKAFSPAVVGVGQPSTLTITLTNANASPVTGVAFTDTYPAGLANAATPALASTCGGSVTGNAGAGSLALSGGTIPAGGSCTVSVSVVASVAGDLVNSTGAVTTGNAGTGIAASATLTVLAAPVATKAFAPSVIGPGQVSTLTITLANANATAVTGAAFTDTYPAGLVNTGTPTVSNTCGGTATATAGGGSLTLAGGTIPASGSCVVSVTVTSAASGSYANTTGPIATANAGTGAAANATLLVLQAVTVTKAFVAPSIGVNDTSLLTITLANPNATAVTGAAFTDTYPAGLVNAASPAAATTCAAGTATATAGGGSLAFAGGTVPANASCTVTVGVTSAATGSYLNSTGPVTTANAGTAAAGTATLTVLSHPAIAKAFSPAEIPVGGVSTLTLTLTNGNGGDAITGAAFTDTYPAGLVNTTPASIATTCGGTASGAAGGNAVSLAGGTIPAGGSCTVTATVTSATANAYTNSVAAGGLTSANAGSSTAPATATLAVLSPLVAAKQFTPASIGTNDLSLLTITFTNPNPTSAVTGVAFTDTYPAGLVNAASPAVSSSCGGTVSATGGGNTLTFSGATVPAGGTCTVTVNVTSAATGLYVNSTGPVTTTNAGTTGAVTASLTVLQHLAVAKAFSPSPVGTGALSTLTITLTNPNATPLTGVAFTDTYPAGLVNAATPNGATTCAAGTVSASAGAGTASLAGGVVPANASCTVTVSVTSATPGSYTNTLAAGAVTTTNAGASTAPASATLGVFNAATIAKSFAPAAIAADGTSTVTFQLSNANPIPLTGGAFTDTLANMRVNAAGAAGGTCAGAAGNVLTAGQTALAFTGLTVPANGSCTVTVVVTSDTPGANPNTTSGVTTNEAPAGAASNTAILTVAAGTPTIAKAFSPTSIAAAGVSTVTLTLSNPNAVALTGGAFTDTLANMRVAANQNAGGTCAGAGGNALTAGQASLAFAGLTVPANGSCTVTFTVTSNTAGAHPNTTSGVSSNEAATGAASNTATLTVNVNAATIAKAFSPASIAYVSGVSTLTFTLSNTNAIALTAGAFTDSLSGMAIAANQAAGGTCAGAAANTFTAGATALSFTGLTIPATGSCTVSVTVSSASVGAHPNVSSGVTTAEAGTGAVSNSATLTVTALAPTIAKSFTPNVIGNTQESTLLVTIGNPNDAPITITGVTDNFIANLVRAATPSESTTCTGGVVTSTATSVTLTGGTLPANATCTFQIHVQGVIPGTALVNTIPAGALVTNIGANTAPATAILTILPAADIRVTKAGPATVASGGAITYTIVVANFGPDPADASTMSDTVPAGVTGVGASCGTPTGGAACGAVNVAGNAVTSTITTLPTGGSVTFTITGTAPATGTFTNSVIALPPVGTADPDDPGRIGANTNGASATTTVLTVDLQLSKTHAGSFTAGSNGVYTLVVNNTLGAAPTAGVITVTDTLPAGLTFVSATGTTWTCAHAAGVVTCTSSAVIAAGAISANPITLTVAVGPTAVPNVTNAATVSGGGEPAVNNGNNAAADYTVVVPAGSNTFQPDGNLATTPGSSVAYPHTFTAGLAGTVTFTTASAQSPAVPGWTQVVYRDANCNGVLDGAESASPIGAGLPLAAGDSLCIVVIDNVPAAAPYGAVNVISVTATFNGTLTYTRTDTTTVAGAGGAGLTLAKSVRNVTLGGAPGTANTARPNDVLEYTVTYTNGGAGPLNSIVITDATPAFTTFQSATCTAPLPASLTACSATTQPSVGGTGSIAWTLTGSLAPAASGTVVFTVRVNP